MSEKSSHRRLKTSAYDEGKTGGKFNSHAAAIEKASDALAIRLVNHSTVTLLARLRGLSTSRPSSTARW